MSTAYPPVTAPAHRDGGVADPWWKSARLPGYVALVIALIAVAAAAVALFHPLHHGPSFGDQQTALAKKNICSASLLVNKAVFADVVNPRPEDPVGQIAVGATIRLASLGGGAYLRDAVGAEPATPADLAKAATSMANTLQVASVNYLANTATPNVLNALKQDLTSEMRQINKICGFKQ